MTTKHGVREPLPFDQGPIRALILGFAVLVSVAVLGFALVAAVTLQTLARSEQRAECRDALAAEYDLRFARLLADASATQRDSGAITRDLVALSVASSARLESDVCAAERRLH
jgi:hypothetical protein